MARRKSKKTEEAAADEEQPIVVVEPYVDRDKLEDVIDEMLEDDYRIWMILPSGDDHVTVIAIARDASEKDILVGYGE